MPGFDRTGPWGGGPMTGRGLGMCAGVPVGRGGAWGRGWRHRFWYHVTGLPGWARPWPPAPFSAADEAAALREQQQFLRQQLDAIGKRLEEIQSEDAPGPED